MQWAVEGCPPRTPSAALGTPGGRDSGREVTESSRGGWGGLPSRLPVRRHAVGRLLLPKVQTGHGPASPSPGHPTTPGGSPALSLHLCHWSLHQGPLLGVPFFPVRTLP